MKMKQAIAATLTEVDDAGETGPNRPPLLLIVDDIADNRTILTRRFQRRGFEIIEAQSGPEALALIGQHDFDTVMLDVMMPEMDGEEVLRRIRQMRTATQLPVIMVTARSQSEDVVTALALGANDYVTKPVDFAVALARVTSQVDRKRAQEQVVRAAERLQQLNRELESRVRERTASLVAANERLEHEIAQRERSQAQNEYLARHDSLTGLANRLLFREELSRALRDMPVSGRRVAILFIDLDGFKAVNDGLGHSAGDALLRTIAARLRNETGDEDRIARLGGDEFAVLTYCDDEERVPVNLGKRIITALTMPADIDGQPVHVGASVGIAVSTDDYRTPEELLKAADMAMYRAKADGRGTVRVFDPSMDACAQARRLLELDLRRALSEGNLRLHYQPLLDLQTGHITGFEALMRWYHPQRGLVSPAEFIPVAEELGLIVALGEWALREACAEAATWPGSVKIAVNLSPIQFLRGAILPAVVSALATSGLSPQRLELEITESVLLDKSERNIEILHQLRALGVRISMDDFGTGYSSLSYLRSFPFDKIKIDQSFVRDLVEDGESRAIVQAITGLGASFGITTTAEGVETDAQFAHLRAQGCDEVQGRLFSMPVPGEVIFDLLETYGFDGMEGIGS